MGKDKSLEILKEQWKTLTFCKFRGLVYEKGDEQLLLPSKRDCAKYKSNFDFKEILKNSELYMSDFEKFNDVDEGRYWFYNNKEGKEDKEQNKKLAKVIEEEVEKVRHKKLHNKICSFSFESELKESDLDLMWAHYANAHCGVRIDFRINPSYQGKIYEIEYNDQALTYNLDEIPQHLMKIMTTKKECFGYEREYRAIKNGNSDKEYLPILIQKITLGRKFAENPISNNKSENGKFDENVIRIAKQILEIWKSGNKNVYERGDKTPEIWAYKSRYSPKPEKIKEIELRGY